MEDQNIAHETIEDLKKAVEELFMKELRSILGSHNTAVDESIGNYKNHTIGAINQVHRELPKHLGKELEKSDVLKVLVQSTTLAVRDQLKTLVESLIGSKDNACIETIEKIAEALPANFVQEFKDKGCVSDIVDLSINRESNVIKKDIRDIVEEFVNDRGNQAIDTIRKMIGEAASIIGKDQLESTHKLNLITIISVLNTLCIIALLAVSFIL